MVSRRNYFAIVMLMMVLMFLLMGSTAFRDELNEYNNNSNLGSHEEHQAEINLTWNKGAARSTAGSVTLIGNSETECGKAVQDWARYTRREFIQYTSLKDFQKAADAEYRPEMLILDSAFIDWNEKTDTEYLTKCAEERINLIFCTLPKADVVKRNGELRKLLGIRSLIAEQKSVTGLYLYAGFLLGGAKIYQPYDNMTELQKTQLRFPGDVDAMGNPVLDWYKLGPGTKIYMRGIPDDTSDQQTRYPPVIWRRSYDMNYVFAINGSYMKGPEGIGILAAIAAEIHQYEIYPIVNAQNLILIDYPIFSDENPEEMKRIYSRSAPAVHQEILWVSIQHIIQQYGYKATCMMSPELDYSDDIEAEAAQLDYYLKIFNEVGAEAGLSLVGASDTSVEQKVKEDAEFFEDTTEYVFSSAYTGSLSGEEVEKALQSHLLSSVGTTVSKYSSENDEIISEVNSMTDQASFDTGFTCTYKQDFQMRCLETALGYTSLAYDMRIVTYPTKEADRWEKLSKKFQFSIDGYAALFPMFDKTTASQCSDRIWTFFTTQYTDRRESETIHLQTSGTEDAKWFILRTHNETVSQIQGGSWKEIEDGAYLIEAQAEELQIKLEPVDNRPR